MDRLINLLIGGRGDRAGGAWLQYAQPAPIHTLLASCVISYKVNYSGADSIEEPVVDVGNTENVSTYFGAVKITRCCSRAHSGRLNRRGGYGYWF